MPSPDNIRKIIHVDMDAFFASVEQRDFPNLKGKAVAVGGGSMRGVVAAASYEARKFGVHSAMPSLKAKRLCPHLIFVKGRMDIYREVSEQVRTIFFDYTDLVEPLSIDEAYMDVTTNKHDQPSAIKIALDIKKRIYKTTQLTASAGVSFNKFLAKSASGINKPDGFKVILPKQAIEFLEHLPIEKFHGIGKVTSRRMHEAGIYVGADLKRKDFSELTAKFGKIGRFYYNIVRGIDDRPVNPDRTRKSISVEKTFAENLTSREELKNAINYLSEKLIVRMQKSKASGSTLTLKIKYEDFTILTRNSTSNVPISDLKGIIKYASSLLVHVDLDSHSVRLLGIGISTLHNIDKGIGSQLQFDF